MQERHENSDTSREDMLFVAYRRKNVFVLFVVVEDTALATSLTASREHDSDDARRSHVRRTSTRGRQGSSIGSWRGHDVACWR
jgi:hypothetical protein